MLYYCFREKFYDRFLSYTRHRNKNYSKSELISGMGRPARHNKTMQVCLAVNGPKKNKHDQRIKEEAKVASEEGLLLLCLNSVSELSILFNLFEF